MEFKIKVFTEESIEKVKKNIPKGFEFNAVNDARTIIIKSPRDEGNIEVWKEIDGFDKERVKSSRINWSAIGSVPLGDAKKFHRNFSESIKIAEILDSELKIEMKTKIYGSKKQKFVKEDKEVKE